MKVILLPENMERTMTTTIKAINSSVSPQPIFDNLVEPSGLSFTTFSHRTTLQKDVSFQPYMKLEEQTLPAEDSELSIFDAQKYFNDPVVNVQNPSKKIAPEVIGQHRIPERDCVGIPRISSSSSIDRFSCGKNCRAPLSHATPTASSEASWNSQAGLLTNQPGAFAVSIRNPPPCKEKKKSAKKWLFGQKCPCYGRRSIMVEELSEPRSSNVRRNGAAVRDKKEAVAGGVAPPPARIVVEESRFLPGAGVGPANHRVMATGRPFVEGANGFTFPILTQAATHKKIFLKGPIPAFKARLQDPPRDSLEVFQPPEDTMTIGSTKPTNAADHLPRQNLPYPGSPKIRTVAVDDDMASDASSDLFEIESFSTQSTSLPTYNTSLDEAANFNVRRLHAAAGNGGHFYSRPSVEELQTPSVAATECYEPSEVSIDWSVVTAEGFDRGSSITSYSVTALASNYQEIIRLRENKKMGTDDGAEDGGKRRLINAGGLLSCHCEEAVNVGPQPVRCAPEEGHRVAIPTSKHVSSRPPYSSNYKTALVGPNAARMPITFAI